MARIARPVAPVARDPAIIAERVVKRSAFEAEIVGLGLAHRIQQLEARDILVAARGHQRHLRVQQFLLGVEHVEDGAGADAVLSARAFKRIAMIEQEIASAGDGDFTPSDEYQREARKQGIAGPITGLLLVVAIYLMVTKPGL